MVYTMKRILTWIAGIVLGLTMTAMLWMGSMVVGYTNRGFQLQDAVIWAMNDVKYELGLNKPQEGIIPEWYDGIVNDNITDWNWQHFY